MALGEYERQALLFNLHAGVVPEEADPVEMQEVMKMLLRVFRDGKAIMRVGDYVSEEGDDPEEIEEGDNVILIKDMIVDGDGVAHFLLHHGDASAADPALIQIKSGVVRRAGKKAGEGLAHASHLLVSTTKHLSKSGQSHALLERVPNLGRSTVIAFLNRLLRIEAKEKSLSFVDKKTKRQYRYHPKLLAQQQMSHQLKSDLEGGKLSRIEFVTRHVAGGFEEKNRVVPVAGTIVHKVVNAPTGKAAFDLLERARVFAKGHNYEEMQIRFKKTDTEQQVSPRFATDLADARDAIYSRFEILPRFKKPLEQCPQDFVPAVRTALKGLFDDKELWK